MTLLHIDWLTIGIDTIQSSPATALWLWLITINIDISSLIIDWTIVLLMNNLRLWRSGLGDLIANESTQNGAYDGMISLGVSTSTIGGQDHDHCDEELFHVNSLK
jgi:hypothetical protein